ncbi:MAG TPA: DoxX family protein [Acidimicrobiales bacterium]|nr:DoxX family protein [Acidimicrobiales bacterium]
MVERAGPGPAVVGGSVPATVVGAVLGGVVLGPLVEERRTVLGTVGRVVAALAVVAGAVGGSVLADVASVVGVVTIWAAARAQRAPPARAASPQRHTTATGRDTRRCLLADVLATPGGRLAPTACWVGTAPAVALGGALMGFGLLVLRLVVGALFIGHGTQKLFGWFGGHGVEGTGGFMESLGYRPGKQYAVLGGIAEAGGGLLLFLGLLTPLAAAAIIGTMINAIFAVHVENGAWAQNNGYEYPMVLAIAAGAIAIGDGGAASLDKMFGLNLGGLIGWLGIFAGIIVGVIAANVRSPEEGVEADAAADDENEARKAA